MPGPRPLRARHAGAWRRRLALVGRAVASRVRAPRWSLGLVRHVGLALPARPWRRCSGLVRRAGLAVVARGRPRLGSCGGQASVELVAVLPLVLVVLAGAFQAVLAGEAVWQSRVAARAAARAHSLGADPVAAARAHLPARLERGLHVQPDASGDVRVSVRIPAVFPSVHVGRVGATSHFRPQR